MNIIIRAFVKMRELLEIHTTSLAGQSSDVGQRDHAIAVRLITKDVQNLAKSVKENSKHTS